MKILLAAGGTGGHVFPALALAAEATAAGFDTLLLGASGGMEERLAREAGVPFRGVSAGKWRRGRPDPRQAWRAVRGVRGAIATVRSWRPDVVVGFGGFASFPGCLAATLTGTPLVLHEGNAFPGRVTRWFAGRAAWTALAWAEADARLPNARRTEVVGFPVRERRLPRVEARTRLGLPPSGTVTLVMGGSQGSSALNDAAPAAYRRLAPERRGTVLHAAGPRWAEGVRDATRDLQGYRVAGFVDAVLAWSAADLAVTRAGVGTLAEAAFHGVPLLMLPLPSAADDHQRHNARAVQDAGGGILIEQHDAAGLTAAWSGLLDDRTLRRAGDRIAARSPVGAARRLLDGVQQVVTDGKPSTTAPGPQRREGAR
ncbi:MAG: UDP-N-acetylglucosamine--N-acetylmuramyl-(pentapeptide) pyrophosphoryl-undecaprenol N-acetylglucosamine transferase [Trueperaceae bacterium]